MARLQIDTGLPDVSADVIVPEYSRSVKARGGTRAEYYANRNLPVLWLLHGYGGNSADWLRYSQIELFAEEKGVVVVCPSAENSCYVNMAKGIQWEDVIADCLWATAHGMLPTSDKPEDNFVAGVDIGGYGAVKLAIAPRPARFSLAGSFNGELELAQEYVEGRFAYPGGYDIFGDAANVLGGANDLYHAAEIFKAGGRIAPKLYLSCNTKNKSYDANVRFREKLVSLGFDAAWNEEDGDGGWRSLNKQLETFMDALPL